MSVDIGLTSASLERLAAELESALGEDAVALSDALREQHGGGETYHAVVPPDIVVFPTSTEDVVQIVECCVEHGAPIVPHCAGTALEGHLAALHGGVSVDMTRMNRILEVNVEDLDVTVEAGVTRKQLEERLAREGVFFPVDPGADATIGGMVSTGATGTTTVRYGGMRENVISLEVVTAAGDVLHTASRARKSAAGYDLTRLFVGSEGTLGIVTKATLRAYGIPEAIAAAVCAFPTVDAAVDCAMQTVQLG
ncbi:MAG: FAD-binding oxidoreductase, partial [Gaiellaceae bacterium]